MAVPPKSGYFSPRWIPTKERLSESLCLRTQFLLAVHSAELGTGKMKGCSSVRRSTLCDMEGDILSSLAEKSRRHFSCMKVGN
jgi:hypothetical protein